MTKNKTLAVVLTVLFVLVLVVALGQSVFRVGKVELVAHTTTNYLSSLNETTVMENSKLSKGKSVFLLDRDDYKNNLEKNQPYIKVLSIEVEWPNVVKFHYAERVELYAVLLNDGAYALVDEDFKVLKITKNFVSNQQNCVVLNCDSKLSSLDIETGMFLDKKQFADVLGIKDAYLNMGYNESQFKSMVSDISFANNNDGHTTVLQTFLGVKIQILNCSYYTDQKITLAYSMLNTLQPSEYGSGTIYVFKNKQSVLESMYIA